MVVPWEHQYGRYGPVGWLAWGASYLVTKLVSGFWESVIWLIDSRKALLALVLIVVPVCILTIYSPHEWLFNWPVMAAGAAVLLWVVWVPLAKAPSFLRKITKLGAALLLMFSYASFLDWQPFWTALEELGLGQRQYRVWFFLTGDVIWFLSSVSIAFSKPQRKQVVAARRPTQQEEQVAEARVPRNVPPERFADIGGLEAAKSQIRDVIQAQLRPEKYKKYGVVRNGVLLHGPRGTGKTLLARAAAGEFDLNFEYVPASELHSRWIGATGENIQARFARAAERRPVLFFIDEIDSLGATRGSGGGGDEGGAAREFDNITTALFTSIDKYRALSGFILMASTNRLDAVDPAVIREKRFDVMVRVDLPDEGTRLAIFEKQLKKRPWKPFSLEEFAHKTPGASGAKIEAIVDRAAEFALRENRKIERRDLSRAIDSGGQDRPLVKYVGWADVVVDDFVSQDLQSLIRLINDPTKTEKMGMRVPTGLLLIGPPGTGKTLIAQLIASQTNRSFYPLTAADVLSGNTGDSVKRVKSIFARAKEHSPSLIFLDEMDGLLPTNGRFVSQHDVQVVEQFLTEISGLEPEHNVFLVGTTNHPENIDPRVLRGGRFSEKIVIGLPGLEGRKTLLSKYLHATRLEPGITIESIATQLDGRVPADLEAICITAKRMAFNRNGSAEEVPPLNWSDFEKAIQRVQGAA